MIPLFKVFMDAEAGAKVTAVLNSGYIGEGEKVKEFEHELKRVLNSPTLPVAVNSCTSALSLALHLLNVKPGDEIITTAITCTATNSPAITRGAKLVFADVDPITGNIDPDSVEDLITDKTVAIIAVDWSGRACDYKALRKVAEHIPIIQDAAHGPLVFDGNKHTGDIICLSFQAIKHLTTVDGGAIIFNFGVPEVDNSLISRAKLLRWYGLDREGKADFRCAQDITEVGYKFHMNDVNAQVGLSNIKSLRSIVASHNRNAAILHAKLENVVSMPEFDPLGQYWVFPILSGNRDELKQWLGDQGIMSSQVHARNDKHTAFGGLQRRNIMTKLFDDHQLNLPCGWWVTPQELDYIADSVKKFHQNRNLVIDRELT